MKKKVSTFHEGINSDITKAFNKDGTYTHALNVDVIIDESESSVSLVNSKGTKLQTSIPTTYGVTSFSTEKSGSSTISIGGVVSPIWNADSSSTNEGLADFIKASYPTLVANGDIVVSFNDSNVTITSVAMIATFITQSGTGIAVNSDRYVVPVGTHYPIGYGVINDEIYIITTSSRSEDPKSEVAGSLESGLGFIWKLTYDSESFDPANTSINLVYAARLTMSTFWNIPPTGVVARYETDTIKKLWFTDFYNPLRYINVADENIMALDPSVISFSPELNMYKPILKSIVDGSASALEAGMYQAAYRLTKTTGSSTVVSEFSNQVSMYKRPMSSSYKDIIGGGDANKIITWSVDNIDTDYDFIELIVIKRSNPTNLNSYATRIVDEADINNRSELSFDIDGSKFDSGIDISLADIVDTDAGPWFTHCKTIAEKDNILIAANLRNDDTNKDLEFDARAFRSKTPFTTEILVTNNGNPVTYTSLIDPVNKTGAADSPITDDNINENGQENVRLDSNTRFCKYQPGTDRLGGAGKHVSYTFYTVAIPSDNNASGMKSGAFAPYLETPKVSLANGSVDDYINLDESTGNVNGSVPEDQLYDIGIGNAGGWYGGYKNPQVSGTLKGYVRGETYRFGIQFFTKEKTPLFVEWIGDIKMPDAWDVDANAHFYQNGAPFTSISDFRTCSNYNNITFVHSLGIRFDVTGLEDMNIGGYSIVRAERTDADKTIIQQGYVNEAAPDWARHGNNTGYWGDVYSQRYLITTIYSDPRYGMLRFPYKTYQSIDEYKLRYVSIADTSAFKNDPSQSTNKFRDVVFASKHTDLREFKDDSNSGNPMPKLGFEDSGFLAADIVGIYNNNRGGTVYSKSQQPGDLGNRSWYFQLDRSAIPSGGATSAFGIANLEAINPNQYGGNNYNDRSKTKYISCGHYRPILEGIPVFPTESFSVFGGDTYICLYVSCLKYWDRGLFAIGSDLNSQIAIVPLEVSENTYLMEGKKADGVASDNNAFTRDYYLNRVAPFIEDNIYNNTYSAENNIKTYIQEPNPFPEVDKWINRFAASDVKINGELSDSWTVFPFADVWDADGLYGGINALIVKDHQMFFWQDTAMGIIQIQPRVAIGDLSNPNVDAQIQMGFGDKLQRHDYLSVLSGSRHANSITSAMSGLYWMDSDKKRLMKYAMTKKGKSINPLEGLYAYLIKNFNANQLDKPAHEYTTGEKYGISSVYDEKRGKIFWTIHNNNGTEDKSFTVCYNELTKSFTSFFSFKPNIYMTEGKGVLSFNDEDIHVHEEGDFGMFYGNKEKSTIDFVVNEDPTVTKSFRNMEIHSDSIDLHTTPGVQINKRQDTWDRIRFTNDHQNTDFQDLVYNPSMSNRGNIMRTERTWKLAIPKNRVLYNNSDSPNIFDPNELSPTNIPFGERMRDKYIKVELEYDNNDNNMLKTNTITTTYTGSPR